MDKSLVPHACPSDDYDEVRVARGQSCPNGCGWVAPDRKGKMLVVRLDPADMQTLARIQAETKAPTRSDAVRQALNYWQSHHAGDAIIV